MHIFSLSVGLVLTRAGASGLQARRGALRCGGGGAQGREEGREEEEGARDADRREARAEHQHPPGLKTCQAHLRRHQEGHPLARRVPPPARGR